MGGISREPGDPSIHAFIYVHPASHWGTHIYIPRGGVAIKGVREQFVRFHPTSTWAKNRMFVPEHYSSTFCRVVQHTAIHCNTLHHTTWKTTSLQLGLLQRLALQCVQRVAVIRFSHPKSKYFVLEHYSLTRGLLQCLTRERCNILATHCNAPLEVCFTWLQLDLLWLLARERAQHAAHMWHNSFTCVTWLIHTCDMTHSHMWHDSFTHVTWLVRTCDITHSHRWHDSFTHMTWLIRICEAPDTRACPICCRNKRLSTWKFWVVHTGFWTCIPSRHRF